MLCTFVLHLSYGFEDRFVFSRVMVGVIEFFDYRCNL